MISAASRDANDGARRIVFDFAGVVFDWQPVDLVRRYLSRHAPDAGAAPAVVAAVFENFGGDWAQFDRGLVEPDDLVQRIVARTGFDLAGVAALVRAIPHALAPRADTAQLLAQLRAAGAALHFLSNMPRPYADQLDRTHPALMQHFDSGLYSGHVELIKPEPAIFARAVERFGVPAHRLLLIDDMQANVEAARRQGWQAIQFTGAADCERALRAAGWWPGGPALG